MNVTDYSASEKHAQSTPPHVSSTIWASLAAIGSVLAASSCRLSVLPFLFAVGTAGGSGDDFTFARPYLLSGHRSIYRLWVLSGMAGEAMRTQAWR